MREITKGMLIAALGGLALGLLVYFIGYVADALPGPIMAVLGAALSPIEDLAKMLGRALLLEIVPESPAYQLYISFFSGVVGALICFGAYKGFRVLRRKTASV